MKSFSVDKKSKSQSRFLGAAFLLAAILSGCGGITRTTPTLISLAPAAAAQGQVVAVTLTGTDFATGATIAVTGTGITITNTVFVSATQMTATFTVAANALPGAQSVTVTSAEHITNALSFTVVTVGLAVSSTNPARAATTVPINQIITASFNEPMRAVTLTAPGTFIVTPTLGGAAFAGAVSYDAASQTAIFTPAANLAASTEFTATIAVAAESTSGNFLPAAYSWMFTTGTLADATAPTVTSTNPASAATLVPLNQQITAAFSKAMNPTTISAAGTVAVVVTTGGAAVPGTLTYDTPSRTLLFVPTAALTASTQYTVTISPAAKDLSGSPLIAGAAPNPWSFTTGTTTNTAAPTITLTSPVSASTGAPENQAISATFSAAMNPTTINNASFTVSVAGANGTAVAGTVTYDAPSDTATFTPTANLAASTTYTATILDTVENQNGVALAPGTIPNPWSFTVGTAAASGPQPVSLGSVAPFGDFGGGAGMTNSGLLTVINGDIGTTAVSTAVTGFHDAGPGCTYTETGSNAGKVNGLIYTAPPTPNNVCITEGTTTTQNIAIQALADANTAYNNLSPAVLPGGADPGAGQLGGLTLMPGIYKAAGGSFMITGSNLTLDAKGNANAVWVFQMASTLTVGDTAPRSVILINGAQAKNVFWQVGTAATINGAGGGTMVGTIIASSGVTFSTAGLSTITTLNGRALGLNASVTMVNTVINVPAP